MPNDDFADIYLRSDLLMGVKLAGDMNYIFYDELYFGTLFDFEIVQEVVFGNIKKVRADQTQVND
mgnify:CR=1 FL=1